MIGLSELHEVSWRARNPSWQSHLNCGAVSAELREEIHDHTGGTVEAQVVEGKVSRKPRARWGAEHAWVEVPESDVEGAHSRVIIDGTLDQFCEENKEEGIVDISLGPRARFDRVEVLQRGDELYDHYLG